MGFSLITHPYWGTPISENLHIFKISDSLFHVSRLVQRSAMLVDTGLAARPQPGARSCRLQHLQVGYIPWYLHEIKLNHQFSWFNPRYNPSGSAGFRDGWPLAQPAPSTKTASAAAPEKPTWPTVGSKSVDFHLACPSRC